MNPSTCGRRSCRRIPTRPRLSAPLTANTLFAKSIPIVVTSIEPLAFRMLLTHPWPIARPFIAGGVHTISLEPSGFSGEISKILAYAGLCGYLICRLCHRTRTHFFTNKVKQNSPPEEPRSPPQSYDAPARRRPPPPLSVSGRLTRFSDGFIPG